MIHDLIPQLNRMPCTVSQTPFVVAIFSQGCHRSLIASPRGVSKTDSWGLAPNQRINIPSTLSCSGDPHACWSLKSQLMGEGEQAAGTAPRTGTAGQRRPRAQAEPAGWAGFGAVRGEAPGRGGAGGKATAGRGSGSGAPPGWAAQESTEDKPQVRDRARCGWAGACMACQELQRWGGSVRC